MNPMKVIAAFEEFAKKMETVDADLRAWLQPQIDKLSERISELEKRNDELEAHIRAVERDRASP